MWQDLEEKSAEVTPRVSCHPRGGASRQSSGRVWTQDKVRWKLSVREATETPGWCQTMGHDDAPAETGGGGGAGGQGHPQRWCLGNGAEP